MNPLVIRSRVALTKWQPCTTTKPARIRVSIAGYGSCWVSEDPEVQSDQHHSHAVLKVCKAHGIPAIEIIGGETNPGRHAYSIICNGGVR
jgi:hypothetical protein